MDGSASYAQNMGNMMNFGEQKVLSKVNILTTNSLPMENPRNTKAVLKFAEKKCILRKGSAYKHIYQRAATQNQKTKKRNKTYNKEFPQYIVFFGM